VTQDVPAAPRAYELYLRANQLSYDDPNGRWRRACTSSASKSIRVTRRRGPGSVGSTE
jgi:hypothetical protein